VYRVEANSGAMRPSRVRADKPLRGSAPRRIEEEIVTGPREHYAVLASTQDRAIALAKEGAEAGTRVVADRQTHGRGRRDHSWESPEGGLYLSVVYPAPADHLSLVPLALGAGLADSLSRRYCLPLRVKWPNDLLVVRSGVPPSKVAGVLVDAVTDRTGRVRLAVGVGVNVAAPRERFSRELRSQLVSLDELVVPSPSREEVESVVLESLESAVGAFFAPSPVEGILREVRQRLYGVGRRASVDGRPVGVIRSVDAEGSLLLESEHGEVVVQTGDLVVEEGPE
jgi:BirA family transcriptional regulator, biotin operon repressor / biotin---[acetyl-CoA-carboxylase] ligase